MTEHRNADSFAITLADVEAAARRIAGAVVRTPVIRSGPLAELIGAEVYLKLEIFQFTASFKERGAAPPHSAPAAG